MKKIIAIIMLLALVVTVMCSCNMGCGMGSLDFGHLHYDTHHEVGCLDISKWFESGTGIEVKTTDGSAIFFSEGTYILIDNKSNCPFCN